MKYTFYCSLFIFSLFCTTAKAQLFLKGEYIGSSGFKNKNNEEREGSGDAKIISGGVNVPISLKLNENNRPTAWSIGIGAAYASLDNKGIPKSECLSEVLNTQLNIVHLRPLNEKWSLMAVLGAGSYSDNRNLSKITKKNILGQGGVLFIRHLKPNLDIGGGIALNNTFGYPMVFPAFCINWHTGGNYNVRVSLMDAMEISAGIQLNKCISLSITGEMNGILALVEEDGEETMFTHQYIITGFKPELKFGNSFSIPVIAGISAYRAAYFQKRTLKDFFKEREHEPHFSVAPYFSVGLHYAF